MGRGIDARRGLLAALIGITLAVTTARIAVGELPPLSDPRATDRFCAAAALQNRELYDLAAAEWAAFAADFPADPLTASAHYQRGVCFVQLKQHDDARAAFEQALAGGLALEPALEESCFAQLGLAHYNLALAAEGAERMQQLRAAAAAFGTQLERFPDGGHGPHSPTFGASRSTPWAT